MTENNANDTTANLPAKPDFLRDDDALASISDLDGALKLLNAQGIGVTEVRDLGSGFVVVDNKDQLVGKDMIILGGQFNSGDMGVFVSLYIVTEDGGKWIVNDGGTGICEQARKYAEKGRLAGLRCRKGLTRSDYTTTVTVKGKETEVEGTTYYLSSV
jgi:hypothetical protein